MIYWAEIEPKILDPKSPISYTIYIFPDRVMSLALYFCQFIRSFALYTSTQKLQQVHPLPKQKWLCLGIAWVFFPLPGCNRDHQDFYIFRIRDFNRNNLQCATTIASLRGRNAKNTQAASLEGKSLKITIWGFPKMVGFPNNHGVFLLNISKNVHFGVWNGVPSI